MSWSKQFVVKFSNHWNFTELLIRIAVLFLLAIDCSLNIASSLLCRKMCSKVQCVKFYEHSVEPTVLIIISVDDA